MADRTRHAPGPAPEGTARNSLAALRRVLLALFYLSAAVLAAELFFLEHTESLAQLVPFIGLLASVLVMTWLWLRPGRVALRVAQLVMVALLVIGGVGVYLHYQANVEFELERHASRSGWPLFWGAMHGALPALAPGLMGQLGLLGLAYTFRNPARSRYTTTEEDHA